MGMIAATGGLLMTAMSIYWLIRLSGNMDSSPFAAMVPWVYPIKGLFIALSHTGKVHDFLPHLSVVLVIFLIAIGNWHGQLLRDK